MTAKKSSLLERKVLYSDHADTRALLAPENINRSQLLEYAKDAAKWTTGLEQPLAINHYGEPDVAMFDFTSMYAAENACRAKKINRHIECNCNCKNSSHSSMANGTSEQTTCKSNESLLLVGLVGDSLLEPFWPTGSGCARGFLSAMDSAWMVRQWALKRCSTNFNEEEILSVLQEREAIYRLLGQTKSENLNQNYASYTLNPLTRYPNLNSSKLLAHQCRHLLFDDIAAPATNDLRSSVKQTLAAKRLRRATIASSLPFTSGILDGDAFNNRNLMSESIGEESTLTCTNSNDTLMKEEEEEDADEVPNERLVKKSTSAALKREFLNNSHSSNSSLNASKVNTGESSKKRSLVYDAEANDAFEKSLADFEKSYIRGIKSNTDHNYSNGSNSNLTQISSLSTTGKTGGKSLNKSSTFSDVILSPSANNLASIGKSRAKEIEAALRHRRQQASAFNRSEQNCNSPVRSASQKYSKDEHSNRSDSKVSLDKSKFAWLLDHETSGQLSDNPKSDTAAAKSTREPFVSRVKNLEAKLSTASSGIHYFDPAYDNEDTIDRKKIASKGSNVMAAASTLQQLLNPSFQENKLKERALDYRKKNSDIKVVMKMTDETDWNKKKWSQRELQAQGKLSGYNYGSSSSPSSSTGYGINNYTKVLFAKVNDVSQGIRVQKGQHCITSCVVYSPSLKRKSNFDETHFKKLSHGIREKIEKLNASELIDVKVQRYCDDAYDGDDDDDGDDEQLTTLSVIEQCDDDVTGDENCYLTWSQKSYFNLLCNASKRVVKWILFTLLPSLLLLGLLFIFVTTSTQLGDLGDEDASGDY